VWRLAEALGMDSKRPVIFECVGAPGVLQGIVGRAPHFSRIVVVGVCMQSDQIEPAIAINKEVELRFALGYSPVEFHDTLHMIAQGRVEFAVHPAGRLNTGPLWKKANVCKVGSGRGGL